MKLIRYRLDKTEYKGVLDGDRITRINGSFFSNYEITSTHLHLEEIEILPPIIPSKIIGVRKNATTDDRTELPLIFLKPPTTVISATGDIIYPSNIDSLHIEVEVAAVIAKKALNIPASKISSYILGYTIADDITARNAALPDSYTQGKYYDTTTPIGPFIDTNIDISNLMMRATINGKIVQDGSVSDLYFNSYEIISYISSVMTLLPGDIILTGTPSAAPAIKIDDIVELEIDGLGKQRNRVIAL